VGDVELVLEEQLPVRLLDHAVAVRHHLDLAFGGAVAHVVEADPGGTEPLDERRAVLRQAGEKESAVRRDARRARHAVRRVGLRQPRALVALLVGDGEQLAVELEAPAVVGAAHFLAGVAAEQRAELRAAVRAAVEEHAHRAGRIAQHHHRLAGDVEGPVVAGLGHLRLVPGVDPGLGEDLLELLLEYLGIGVAAPVDAVGFDQPVYVFHISLLR
jgi:hypothetical protein